METLSVHWMVWFQTPVGEPFSAIWAVILAIQLRSEVISSSPPRRSCSAQRSTRPWGQSGAAIARCRVQRGRVPCYSTNSRREPIHPNKNTRTPSCLFLYISYKTRAQAFSGKLRICFQKIKPNSRRVNTLFIDMKAFDVHEHGFRLRSRPSVIAIGTKNGPSKKWGVKTFGIFFIPLRLDVQVVFIWFKWMLGMRGRTRKSSEHSQTHHNESTSFVQVRWG